MANIGDVVAFYSNTAGKRKFHLCVCIDGLYLFLNSPKSRIYAGDFQIPCSEVSGIEPTESGFSVISVTQVTKISDAELRRTDAKVVGSVSIKAMRGVFDFIEKSDVLTEEERDLLLNSLGDYI